MVKTLAAQGKEPDADAVTEAGEHLLDDVVILSDGSVVLRIGQGVVLPASEGQLDVVLGPQTAAPLLSELGRQVQAAAAKYAAPEATPAPKPTSEASDASSSTPTPSETASASPSPSETEDATTSTTRKRVDCSKAKCVALTFDDGPGAYTGKLLDTLKANHVHATFFMLGQSAQAYPSLVRRAVVEGNQVGEHTWDHKQLTNLSAAAQRDEIVRGANAIQKASGKRPTILRPPYGAFNSTTKKVAGMPLILWDVDTRDWENRSVSKTTAHALNDSRPGSIILMHDIHPSTVQAVPGIIAGLKKKGYTLVTVDELLGSPTAGKAYFRR